MSQFDPATKQDFQDAISDLKLFIVEHQDAWLKWIVGIQISYFALTLIVVYFAVHTK